MDPLLKTPLVDCFLRGEVSRDLRLVAARGIMAVGLAMVAERPAAARPGDRSPAQRVGEVSFLRN